MTARTTPAAQALTRKAGVRRFSSFAASSLLVPLALVASLAAAPQAQAQSIGTRHALTCLGTDVDSTINFQYRWGTDGEWKRTSVSPGRWIVLTYSYNYEGENRSPQLQVRYDDDFTSEANFVRTRLDSYAARGKHCETEGATYNFRRRGDELYLQKGE